MNDFPRFGEMDGQVSDSAAVLAAFNAELATLQRTVARTEYDVKALEKGLSRGLKSALDDVVMDGARLSDAFRTVLSSVAKSTYNAAVTPVTDHVGSLLSQGVNSLLGQVMPFAKGGVLDSAAAFPMQQGVGLMGEAGPEAIMPLSRGPDGRLGVAASGGGRAVQITMNISTPDAGSFQRSQSQIAHQMRRALASGQRNS